VLEFRLGEGFEERLQGCSEVCVEGVGREARYGGDVWERGHGPRIVESDVGEVERDTRTLGTGGLVDANEEEGPQGDGGCYGCLFAQVKRVCYGEVPFRRRRHVRQIGLLSPAQTRKRNSCSLTNMSCSVPQCHS